MEADPNGGISLGRFGFHDPESISFIQAVSLVSLETVIRKGVQSRKWDIMIIIYKADWWSYLLSIACNVDSEV